VKEKEILIRYSAELILWAKGQQTELIKKEEDAYNLRVRFNMICCKYQE